MNKIKLKIYWKSAYEPKFTMPSLFMGFNCNQFIYYYFGFAVQLFPFFCVILCVDFLAIDYSNRKNEKRGFNVLPYECI